MSLEIYQIIILILIGALVGISMSFVGQTGQGVVLPIVLIITGDVFLAIAVNVLNDLLAASSVSIGYIRKREFRIKKEIFILIVIAIPVSYLGVFILMITPLGSIYGWVIPLFITFLGILFVKNGFPTTETLKSTILKISRKFSKKEGSTEELAKQEADFEKKLHSGNDGIIGIIPSNSRLYFILALVFGIFMGFNSGLFGGNSGLIIVLALIIIYGYPLKKGVGTALILSILVSISTFTIYQILGITIKQQTYFNFEISLFLGIGSIFAGIIASTFIQKLSAKVMGRGIGIIIVILGTLSLMFYFVT